MQEKVTVRPRFGAELCRRRLAANISLRGFAKLVHYTPGHLSKVEHGLKPPSRALVLRADELLGAGGELRALILPPQAESDSDGEVVTPLLPDSVTGLGVADPARVLASCRHMFGLVRSVGQGSRPADLVSVARHQADILAAVAEQSAPGEAAESWALAARFLEYAGWMAQESGDDLLGRRLTAGAGLVAEAGGDAAFGAYLLVRQSLFAMYAGRHDECVALARQARLRADDDRVRGMAALQEAQGHAVSGAPSVCVRLLDRAAGLLASSSAEDLMTPGPVHVVDQVAMATGWCLYELADPAAAEVLGAEVARLPEHAYRARARYETRLALALASAGRVDEACQVTARALGAAAVVDSATVRADLRRLRLILRYRPTQEVRGLLPQLAAVGAGAAR